MNDTQAQWVILSGVMLAFAVFFAWLNKQTNSTGTKLVSFILMWVAVGLAIGYFVAAALGG